MSVVLNPIQLEIVPLPHKWMPMAEVQPIIIVK